MSRHTRLHCNCNKENALLINDGKEKIILKKEEVVYVKKDNCKRKAYFDIGAPLFENYRLDANYLVPNHHQNERRRLRSCNDIPSSTPFFDFGKPLAVATKVDGGARKKSALKDINCAKPVPSFNNFNLLDIAQSTAINDHGYYLRSSVGKRNNKDVIVKRQPKVSRRSEPVQLGKPIEKLNLEEFSWKSNYCYRGNADPFIFSNGELDLDPQTHKVRAGILYTEYCDDNMHYYLKREKKYLLDVKMFKLYISERARISAVNWFIRTLNGLSPNPSMLHLTVRLLDRLICYNKINFKFLKSYIMSVYWLATKYLEEPATMQTVWSFCNDEVTANDLKIMEAKILACLNFDLGVGDPIPYLYYYIYRLNLPNSKMLAQCSQYLLDCLTLNIWGSSVLLSLQAAAAVHLSMRLLNYDLRCWENLSYYPGYYTPSDMEHLENLYIHLLRDIDNPTFEFKEVFKKHTGNVYGNISVVVSKKCK